MFAAVTAYMNFGRQFDPLIRSIWLVVHKHSSIDKMYQNHSAIIPKKKKKDSWAQFPNTLIQSIWGNVQCVCIQCLPLLELPVILISSFEVTQFFLDVSFYEWEML